MVAKGQSLKESERNWPSEHPSVRVENVKKFRRDHVYIIYPVVGVPSVLLSDF